MITAQAVAPSGVLADEVVQTTLANALGGQLRGQHVLILIPDHTRTLPLPFLFGLLVEILGDARRLDFMVALGTHPPLSVTALCRLVGIMPESYEDFMTQHPNVSLFNHAWDNPNALATIGTLTQEQVKAIAESAWHPSLGGDVPVRVNRAALQCDYILIVGPTFPHEVVGFSGGAKYLFPGISGPEMINLTHWLGALITILDTIGITNTPMRQIIHQAARFIPTPITLMSLVVEKAGLAGLFIGDYEEAFAAAAALSAQRHIVWVENPYQRVLSCVPPMYDELWTGAKAMYKLEPAIADGGEIIVYAPHLDTISQVHGHYLYRIGYHVRDYFLKQWERFCDVPGGVLAHSTHLKGSGVFENGNEQPRIEVTLAAQISAADCRTLNLGYMDYRKINPADWQGREHEGILFVPKAGETLYRVR